MRVAPSSSMPWSFFIVALGLAWWIYSPGLFGDFLFDDLANLPALGATGPVTHWATFFRYITSGIADPTGRPLTLLTFLLDGHNWPTAAFPFKRTNVLLHLINGVLLAQLLVQLSRRLLGVMDQRQDARMLWACVTASTLWLVHPLFVSTVLYAVQREAMLPMTWVLAGLLLWLRGRDALMQGRRAIGISWVTAGLLGCTLLGLLSKANGALLPIYAVLVEYLLLRGRKNAPSLPSAVATELEVFSLGGQKLYRGIFLLLAWLPSLLIVAYLVNEGVTGALRGIDRPWTVGQRLLTEPRILFDYLQLLWMPRPFTPGLFNDQIAASMSLWAPLTTVLSMLGVAGLLLLSFLLRRRHPALALSILFYFAGNLLESTSIPLELYFEHRNYIPAMLMFWPLSLWLCEADREQISEFSRVKIVFALALVLGLCTMTHTRSDLWGNSQQQALLWAKLNPESPRAQANAANYEMAAHHPRAAVQRLMTILNEHRYDPQITLNILSAHCQLGGLKEGDLQLAEATLAHMDKGEQMIFTWLGEAIELAASRGCPGLSSGAITGMLDAAESNPRFHDVIGRMQDLDHLRGQLALSLHRPDKALAWFNKGMALRSGPQMAFEQAAMLGTAGYPSQGLKHLEFYEGQKRAEPSAAFGMPRIHAWVLKRQNYWAKELVHLRETLSSDLRQSHQRKAAEGA